MLRDKECIRDNIESGSIKSTIARHRASLISYYPLITISKNIEKAYKSALKENY